ncbi:MAG: hypothetical protein ABWY08_19470 [Comamonas sp.]
MGDFAARIGIGPGPQIALRGMDSAPAAAPAHSSPAIDTKARSGLGALSERPIAVGDGQTGQRLQDGDESHALLAGTSPAVRTMLAEGAGRPASNGMQDLKQRQLDNGDGQGTSLLQKAETALRSLMSGLSDMPKAMWNAPAALFKALHYGSEASVKVTLLAPEDAAAFEASVTSLKDTLATDPLIDKNPVNGFFGDEHLPQADKPDIHPDLLPTARRLLHALATQRNLFSCLVTNMHSPMQGEAAYVPALSRPSHRFCRGNRTRARSAADYRGGRDRWPAGRAATGRTGR